MFNKIFKKSDNSAPADPVPSTPKAPDPAAIAARQAEKAEWEQKLEAARGNDAALLEVAKHSPVTAIKRAAVEAITSEEVLKSVEREFRTHDRRVHQLAKQRHDAAIAQRETRAKAEQLIETATALAREEKIPANRLVELDHAWQALNGAHIEPARKAAFATQWESITSLTRERGEAQLAFTRWSLETKNAITQANQLCVDVAVGRQPQSLLDSARALVTALMATMPAGDTLTHRDHQARLQFALDKVNKTDSDLTNQTTQEEQTTQAAEEEAAKKEQARTQSEAAKVAHREKLDALEKIIVEAEASLAGGHLAETSKQLVAIDEATEHLKPGEALRIRINHVQAEFARLKGWQHWGGGRVRDDLVLEAEALAKATIPEEGKPLKLALKPHADAIDNLRERWKELDRLGGATSRALWKRFDDALKAAYLPVAAQVHKLKLARKENLDARNKLIDALNGINTGAAAEAKAAAPVPAVETSETDAPVVATASAETTEAPASTSQTETPAQSSLPAVLPAAANKGPVDFRELARALEHFQTEWRKLGPVEHTVPHKSREALLGRMRAAVARLEEPLGEARRVAKLKREKLIERAKALAAEAAAKPQARELINKVRDLQSEWQQQAKALSLARGDENALWSEFKTATDGIFKQRDAAFSARDAELKSALNARKTLIERLNALTADTPPADIRRTVSEVESEWRKAPEAPRNDGAKLEQRFRQARDAARAHLAGSAQRSWQATCDSLSAKLALSEEREANPDALSTEDLDARWSAAGTIPAPWETALQARRGGKISADVAAQNTLLLQLETALDMESPAAFQAARRDLKLRALKNAMEGRQSATTTPADIDKWLGTALTFVGSDAIPRDRLRAIIAAMRQRKPS